MSTKSVTILMALYNPKIDWLKVQLDSINNQTYKNIDIVAIDDCSTQINFENLQNIFSSCLKNFSFMIHRNEQNMGSNGTFQRLTELASGEYVAYCDQDDYWYPEKIQLLVDEITKHGAVFCSSDFRIMDEGENVVAESSLKYFKRYKAYEGNNLSKYLLTKNFIPGCTSLYNSKIAKAAIPFAENMVHDHWLALFASLCGSYRYVKTPLIAYRIHGNNQTGILKGVYSKEDYIRIRVDDEYKKFEELMERLKKFPQIYQDIKNLFQWVNARLNYYKGDFLALFHIIKHMRYNYLLSLFDILLLKLPNSLFLFVIKLIRERKV